MIRTVIAVTGSHIPAVCVKNDQFLALGLDPTTLQDGLLAEVIDVAKKFAHRIDRSRVPAVSAWTKDIAQRVDRDPEGKRLRSVS